MASKPKTSDFRHHCLAIVCAAVATASAMAQPDLCGSPLPAAALAYTGAMFRLIDQPCDLPISAHHAPQFDLCDPTAPLALTLRDDPSAQDPLR
jgi:hypothetical protein